MNIRFATLEFESDYRVKCARAIVDSAERYSEIHL